MLAEAVVPDWRLAQHRIPDGKIGFSAKMPS
jgi:hypothetical protein